MALLCGLISAQVTAVDGTQRVADGSTFVGRDTLVESDGKAVMTDSLRRTEYPAIVYDPATLTGLLPAQNQVTLDNGTLDIFGTPSADDIEIRRIGKGGWCFAVELNGQEFRFSR
jgi:hypothetical protein